MKPLFLALFGLFLFLMGPCVSAEPQFNALDPADPQYADYQAALCDETSTKLVRFDTDKYWLDHEYPKLRQMRPAEREDWVVNYVLTSRLRDAARAELSENCTVTSDE